MAISSANEIVADVESRVAEGRLAPGDRLPSVRDVAGSLGLSPSTVAAAYRKLRERGMVVGRGRQGSSIANLRPVTAASFAAVPAGVLDAMTGNPDAKMQPSLDEALAAAARSPRARYGDRIVLDELATVAGGWLERDGVDVTHLTVTSGGMDAIERVLVEHLRVGDRIGVEDPGHGPIHELVATMGLSAVPIELDEQGATPSGLASALDLGVRAVIVTPRAQNPTGAALTADRAAHLDRILDGHPSVLVVEDDHAGPVSGVRLYGLGRDRRSWVLVRSVSKSLGPDLRLALVAGDAETIGAIEAKLAIGQGWVSHLLQRTVANLLDSAKTHDQIDVAAARYTHSRLRLIRALAEAGIASTGTSGLQVWIPVAAEQPVLDAMRAAGFALQGGAGYRIGSPPAVRVTIAALTDDQIDSIAAALIAHLGGPTTTRLT